MTTRQKMKQLLDEYAVAFLAATSNPHPFTEGVLQNAEERCLTEMLKPLPCICGHPRGETSHPDDGECAWDCDCKAYDPATGDRIRALQMEIKKKT